MRILLNLAALGAVALPGAALAQDLVPPSDPAATTVAPVDVSPVPALAPLPTVQPTVDAPPPVSAKPPPAPVDDALAPTPPTERTTRAPVIVAKEEKGNLGGTVGMIAGGVAGGAAGAAVGGPVGKFAGSFLGKRVVGGIFGVGKDKTPELTVSEAPSADDAGEPAVAAPATAPPLKARVANR